MRQAPGVTSIDCALLCSGKENPDEDCSEFADKAASPNEALPLFMIFTIDSSADFFCAMMKSRLQRVPQLKPLGVRWLLKNAKDEAKHAISVDHVAMIGTFIPQDPRCTLSLLHRGNAEAIPRHFITANDEQKMTRNITAEYLQHFERKASRGT